MALPCHHVTVMVFKNPEVVEKMLVENANDPGMYMLPWADHNDEETMKKAMEQWDNGFSMFATVRQMVPTRSIPSPPSPSMKAKCPRLGC